MATYTSTRTAAGVPAKYMEKGLFCDIATYEAAGSSNADANDVIQMINVAAGVTVVDMYLAYDDCGTLTVDVGNGDDVDRFMDGADVGAGGGLARMGANITAGTFTAFPKKYTTADTIDIKILTGAATGTLTLCVVMTAEDMDLT